MSCTSCPYIANGGCPDGECCDEELLAKDLLRYALAYGRLGWRVFPLEAGGKKPRVSAWPYRATTNPEIIRNWWGAHSDSNIGIATGIGSGLVVIDLDGDEGREQWREVTQGHGGGPDTVEALTGGGGTHLLFQHPGEGLLLGNRQQFLGCPDVDVRGDGGYIVAAPSLHPSGRRYQWELSSQPGSVLVAPLPSWLLDALMPREAHPLPDAGKLLTLVPCGPVLLACPALQMMILQQQGESEERWLAKLTLAARMVDGERLAHEWSRSYSGYQAAETAAKFRHARDQMRPVTCQRIRKSLGGEPHCARCPHWGGAVANPKQSPVSLSLTRAAALEAHAPPLTRRAGGSYGA